MAGVDRAKRRPKGAGALLIPGASNHSGEAQIEAAGVDDRRKTQTLARSASIVSQQGANERRLRPFGAKRRMVEAAGIEPASESMPQKALQA